MNFNDLFQDTWGLAEWAIVGLGALIVLFLLFLLLKPKKKQAVTYKEVQVDKTHQTAPKPAANMQSESVVSKKEETPKKEEEPPTKQVKPAKETSNKEEEKDEPATTNKNVPYHVSQNKDKKSKFNGQWRVRKQGSSKTIKYFSTQAEAIKYAEELAESNDTSIVIHKRDGTIRKQDYSKKSS